MEIISGVAATLQLAHALGTTVLKVSQAYSQITCMDDLLHDFDAQLDATRTVLSILDDGIARANSSPNTDGWWRQSELERLLRTCHQHYERLNDIFNKIARQRSSAPAIRAWIRSKRYDHDISHLRICITTCINALQLPLIIHGIHPSTPAASEAPAHGAALALLAEMSYRLTEVETSVDRIRDDPDKRTSQEHTENATATSQLTTINHLLEGLDLDISTLVTSHRAETSTLPSQTEACLAHMQTTISQLRLETCGNGKSKEITFDTQGLRQRQKMEEDTRSMLVIMDDLVDSTKGYISTIESVSTAPQGLPWTPQPSEIKKAKKSRSNLTTSPKLLLVPTQRLGDKVESVEEWIDNVDTDDETLPSSDLSGFHSPSPATTTATTPATQSVVTTTSEKNFRYEILRRRIQAVEDMMESKSYAKAIGFLELLLSDNSEMMNKHEQDRLYHFMAKAIALSKMNTNQEFYARFPPLESMVTKVRLGLKLKKDKANLAEATEALDTGDYDRVLDVLVEYQSQTPSPCSTAGLSAIERRTMQKIQLAHGRSLLYSRGFWDIGQSIRIMEALLKDNTPETSDRAIAHGTLARAYQLKRDYVKSKFHGEEAYQILQGMGRNDEEIWGLIELMVRICAEAQDPDGDFWSEMISERVAARNRDVKGAFTPREELETCLASERLRDIVREPGADGAHTTGIKSLKTQYTVPSSGYVLPHDILCWDCLDHQFNGDAIVSEPPDRNLSCQHHQAHGKMTRGFSIIHFFAIAQPIESENRLCPDDKEKFLQAQITDDVRLPYSKKMTSCESSFPAEDCVDEISILLRDAQRNEKEYMPLAQSRSIDTVGFKMFDLINRPMDFQPPESSHSSLRAVVVTPVWAAALSGKLSTVLFFLSLRETDPTRGSESIFLLQRPISGTSSDRIQSRSKHQQFLERLKTKRNLKSDTLKGLIVSMPGKNDEADFQNVVQSVLEVFNALPRKAARQLFSFSREPDSHWAFVDSSLLAKVLDKCGEDGADLPVWSSSQNCSKPQPKSVLFLFLNFMDLGYVERFPWAEARDLKNMLRSLLDHSQETGRDRSFKDQSMATLIDHIRNATQSLVGTKGPASLSAPATIESFDLWIEMLVMYIYRGHSLSIGNKIRIQGCIDQLGYCDERLAHMKECESTLGEALDGPTHRRPRWSFTDHFRESDIIHMSKKENRDRFNEALQKKALLAKEKDMLEGVTVIKSRLEKLIGGSLVRRGSGRGT
ncbi:hypothetical protein NW768_008644 [Fusarium equiseti]|uniref:Fungal N-terminal domain-containing protein n=1 Tax=Fusarium equiseti TaxID=61235 RepID=A0ABQ8R4W4_FUSEQ|nr:hypothetical protein NW768_008644 [Fusarium equiseti]